MLTPWQWGKVVIVDVEWIMVVFIMGCIQTLVGRVRSVAVVLVLTLEDFLKGRLLRAKIPHEYLQAKDKNLNILGRT